MCSYSTVKDESRADRTKSDFTFVNDSVDKRHTIHEFNPFSNPIFTSRNTNKKSNAHIKPTPHIPTIALQKLV